MPLITIGQGAPAVEDGNYEMFLTSVYPKTIVPKTGESAGKEVEVLEWVFEDVDDPDIEIKAISSTVFTPKSKAVAWITALLGPDAAQVGASFEATDLVGRRAMVQTKVDENGYSKIVAVTPMPRKRTNRPAPVDPKITDDEQEDLPF
jgi:hypothetical protein